MNSKRGVVVARHTLSVAASCAFEGASAASHAARDNRFAQDAFVRERQLKSVVGLPLVHQGMLVGVLYLENDTAIGVFHEARVERLQFLAGHAAVSLQNARLYDQLQAANDSLERRVRERTIELSERNRDMRRVLDNVTQGLLTIDLEGRLAGERSRIVGEWFGEFAPGTRFRDYIARVDDAFAKCFDVAFEQLLDGLLPEEMLIDQLPTTFDHDSRHFQLSYKVIHVNNELAGLLIVVDDVSEALRRAREEAEQKEVLTLCRRLSRDRAGLLSFFEEAQCIVDELRDRQKTDDTLRRNLHTLKGNAALFGFTLLAERCHGAEDAIAAGDSERRHIELVVERFDALRDAFKSIVGSGANERVDVSRDVLRDLAQRLKSGLPAQEATWAVERLLLEPLALSLGRLGEYAQALAGRVGKGSPLVQVDDGGLFVDRERSAPLFASLVHLMRNAVDHGLETTEERAAANKGRASLAILASESAGNFCLSIQDDGRGIDWDRVKELAEARGLPVGSHSALVEVLFTPEFSTREEVTQLSGRGVGLSAVGSEVLRLGGQIGVESQLGRGTTFLVQLPSDALGLQCTVPQSERRLSERVAEPA
ncbi:MAG: ATP-binding protein [Deltaproteobacteria bacterium]